MCKGFRTISRDAAGGARRDRGLAAFPRGNQDLRLSAGIARLQPSVDDDLAQLSDAKMAYIGDERTAFTLYALGQMSYRDRCPTAMPSVVDRVGGVCMTAARS